MPRSALSLVLVIGTVNAACTGYRPVPNVDVRLKETGGPVPGTPLEQVWTETPGRGLGFPTAFLDTVLYVGGTDRRVVAVDYRNGARRWAARLPGPIVEGVVADDDRVYAATDRPDGKVYAVDRLRGQQVWHTSTNPATAPLALLDGVLIASGRGGITFGLSPVSGKELWHRRLGLASAAAARAGPDRAVVSTLDSLFLLNVQSGEVLARRRSPGVILSPWILHGSTLLAGTTDSSVVALSATDLTGESSARLDAPVFGSPMVRNDTAWVVTRVGTLYRIPLDLPPYRAERLYRLDTPVTTAPVRYQGWLLVGLADGRMLALGPEGQPDWVLQLTAPLELPPVVLPDANLLVFGGRGDVHRYRLQETTAAGTGGGE
ncbi:MAG: PQQ-binding-like beta-propeller repeat protein [Gemmatimonadales bacterium]